MACGLTWAAQDRQQWLFHLDADELLYARDGRAVGAVLARVPPSVPSVRVLNVEAQADAVDITQPLRQVCSSGYSHVAGKTAS